MARRLSAQDKWSRCSLCLSDALAERVFAGLITPRSVLIWEPDRNSASGNFASHVALSKNTMWDVKLVQQGSDQVHLEAMKII